MTQAKILPRYGWLVLSLLLSLLTNAQSGRSGIRGIVVSETGEALNGVSVIVHASSGRQHGSTTTDEKGVFRFNDLQSNARYDFSFSYVGYRDTAIHAFELKPDEENSLMVRLTRANSNLNEIVV